MKNFKEKINSASQKPKRLTMYICDNKKYYYTDEQTSKQTP